MFIARSVFICIVTVIVHCDITTKSKQIIISTENGVAKGNLSNGQPIQLRSQIDVPLDSNTTLVNATKLYHLDRSRRAVLIINQESLRHKVKKKSGPEKAEKLLYEEYNKDGSVYLSYSMSDLDDVAKFFGSYLHTEICHTYC